MQRLAFLLPAASLALVPIAPLHARSVASTVAMATAEGALYDPVARDAAYTGNAAQYLVDLHDNRATFDFCGGMMFQFVLSDKLRARLAGVAGGAEGTQPTVHDASAGRMMDVPDYRQSASADNAVIFHGREIRSVKDAAGGMEFVLQLSDAQDDPEGWSKQEVDTYDGWGHDSGRTWRDVGKWESEGVAGVRAKFGDKAFGLHHRFYLHLDQSAGFWLSAEDGCSGKAAEARRRGVFGF